MTPRNFYRLMKDKQVALLFPGGVRESNHGKDEAYKLFWPDDRAEFVRVAAAFGADIVPFGAIGAADGVTIVRDKDEPLELPPFLGGGRGRARGGGPPSARRWRNDTTEDFRFPLPLPNPAGPARFYFLFGEPVSTVDVDPKDRDACAAVYERVKVDVAGSIEYLLEKRKSDPYERPVPRLLYERARAGAQAPTFELDSDA